jgi:hypothetical protein
MKFYKKNDTVFVSAKNGEKTKLAFFGCVHADADNFADREFKRCADYCLDRDIPMVFMGDLFDGINSRYDPRKGNGPTKDADKKTAYFYRIVETVFDILKPYAHLIKVLIKGNHCLKIEKHNEVDLLHMLADKIEIETGERPQVLGWSGFMRVNMDKGKQGDGIVSANVMLKHGESLGVVTRGNLSPNRLNDKYEGFDLFVFAHGHQCSFNASGRTWIDHNGNKRTKKLYYCQAPSFKKSWEDNDGVGFWEEKNLGPRAIGAWVVEFSRGIGGKHKNEPAIKARFIE